jgi:iron(III) transport system substrate-binding protein
MTRNPLAKPVIRAIKTMLAATALCLCLATAPASAQGSLNVICAPASEWCEAIVNAFARETGVKVNMVRKASGEILAQVRAESQNPKLDLWFGASTDTHFVAAENGFLQPYTSPKLGELHAWSQKAHAQSNGHCVGVSSGAIGIAYNREVLAKKNIAPPKSWADLIDPRFKGEVQLPNPNSSGTSYTIIAGLVQLMGEDKAFDYLKALHANVNAYARSGEAPMKAAARGETGVALSFDFAAVTEILAGFPIAINYPPEGTSLEVGCMAIIKGARNEKEAKQFYDWYLTPAAMDIGPKVNQWHQPAHKGASPHPNLPDPTKIKLIDYDFATFGAAATRKRILERWEREVGSLPR